MTLENPNQLENLSLSVTAGLDAFNQIVNLQELLEISLFACYDFTRKKAVKNRTADYLLPTSGQTISGRIVAGTQRNAAGDRSGEGLPENQLTISGRAHQTSAPIGNRDGRGITARSNRDCCATCQQNLRFCEISPFIHFWMLLPESEHISGLTWSKRSLYLP